MAHGSMQPSGFSGFLRFAKAWPNAAIRVGGGEEGPWVMTSLYNTYCDYANVPEAHQLFRAWGSAF